MIAERAGLVVQDVHRLDHGVDVAVLHAALIGDVVAHGIALQEVAIVEQERVLGFRADRVDDGRGAREADRVGALVGVIVVGKDVDMDVRRLHQPQMRLVGRGTNRVGMQQHGGAGSGRASEEPAA